MTASMLFGSLTAIFECTPIRKAWTPTISGHCVDSFKFYMIVTIWDVLVDVLIMFLPLPVLWRLHTERSNKVTLTGVFLCGYW